MSKRLAEDVKEKILPPEHELIAARDIQIRQSERETRTLNTTSLDSVKLKIFQRQVLHFGAIQRSNERLYPLERYRIYSPFFLLDFCFIIFRSQKERFFQFSPIPVCEDECFDLRKKEKISHLP